MIMEPMSTATSQVGAREERFKLLGEVKRIAGAKRKRAEKEGGEGGSSDEDGGEQDDPKGSATAEERKKKKRNYGKKGANPLSTKSKKKKTEAGAAAPPKKAAAVSNADARRELTTITPNVRRPRVSGTHTIETISKRRHASASTRAS